MDFQHVPEPYLTELTSYARQRRDQLILYSTLDATRSELLRNVIANDSLQQKHIDRYPRGRQLIHDDEYVLVIRDLLNLSSILDDIEQGSHVPYQTRTQYYNLYAKLYRLATMRASKG